MTLALIVLAAALAFVVVVLAGVAVRSRLAPGPVLTGRTLVVHTRRPDDQTLRGVLHGQYADRLTLRDAVYVHPSGEQPAGGLVHVPLANVSWVQEIEPPGGGE